MPARSPARADVQQSANGRKPELESTMPYVVKMPTPWYQVEVQVSDGQGGTATQALTVDVTNVNEATLGGSVLGYAVNGIGNSQTVTLTDAPIFDGDLVTGSNPQGQARWPSCRATETQHGKCACCLSADVDLLVDPVHG